MPTHPNYPRPNNPLVIRFMKNIPALKNEKSWNQKTGKPRLHRDVTDFFRYVQHTVAPQVVEAGFSIIPITTPVAVYAELAFSAYSKHGIPTKDGDNSYTTLQETLEIPHKVNNDSWSTGAILAVIERDRQVMSVRYDVYPRSPAGAVLYVWAFDLQDDRRESWMEFDIWYAGQERNATVPIKMFTEDMFIGFGENLDAE